MRIACRVLLALGAMALVGCGGKPLAPGKEAAAGALFQASRGSQGIHGAQPQVTGWPVPRLEVKVPCQRGGEVGIVFTASAAGAQAGLTYELVYRGCSHDGRTSLDGTMRMTFEVLNDGTSLSLALHLQGRVTFSGEISDFLEVNVTETAAVADIGAPSASVTLTLDGSVTNSSGTYTFSNETLVIDGTGLQKAPDPPQG